MIFNFNALRSYMWDIVMEHIENNYLINPTANYSINTRSPMFLVLNLLIIFLEIYLNLCRIIKTCKHHCMQDPGHLLGVMLYELGTSNMGIHLVGS